MQRSIDVLPASGYPVRGPPTSGKGGYDLRDSTTAMKGRKRTFTGVV
jgi:hypothetical protein